MELRVTSKLDNTVTTVSIGVTKSSGFVCGLDIAVLPHTNHTIGHLLILITPCYINIPPNTSKFHSPYPESKYTNKYDS